MSSILSQEDIVNITRKKRFKAQIRALREMGIDVKPRPDGSPLVNVIHFNQVTGVTNETVSSKTKVKLNL